MAEFQTPTDIGNRALQHIGQRRMGILGFAEQSKAASEVGACYGKLRRAELRRNVWRFAIRRAVLRPIDSTVMLVAPAMWVSATTYLRGAIVTDEAGNLWSSTIPTNQGNQPGGSALWEPYFGPLSVSLYDSTVAYWSGELVYTAAGDGTYRVYLSRRNDNSDAPATGTAWDSTSTYALNDVVTKSAVSYMSLIDLNTGNDPATTTVAKWSSSTTYAMGAKATGSSGSIYTSNANGNIGHDPFLDSGANWTNTNVLSPWTTSFSAGTGSSKWLQVGGAEVPGGVALTTFDILYPIGAGPSTQTNTRNIFRLPSGFLKKAPTDPKAGINPSLGAPAGPFADDWLFEGDYIVSRDVSPIVLRFVADMSDVSRMDDMFCEGLGARIAYEVCEPLTQSTDKQAACLRAYETFMTDARTVNAIEIGSEDPPLDDLITCRM